MKKIIFIVIIDVAEILYIQKLDNIIGSSKI